MITKAKTLLFPSYIQKIEQEVAAQLEKHLRSNPELVEFSFHVLVTKWRFLVTIPITLS